MVTVLKVIFALILITMLAVTSQAAMKESIFMIPPVVTNDPWFIATLFDAYFGFLVVFFWVCHRERSLALKGLWFVLFALLGNIGIAIYALIALFRLRPGQDVEDLFKRKEIF
jgi:hypothetical protein